MSDSIRYLLNDIDTHLGEQLTVQRDKLRGERQLILAAHIRADIADLQSLRARARVRDVLAELKESA